MNAPRTPSRSANRSAAALAAALAEERDRSRAVERHLWETAKYFVSLGLPLSTALRVLGVSRATWYRRIGRMTPNAD